MTKLYKQQQEILKLFTGKDDPNLDKSEIDSLNLYKGLVINSAESLLAKIFKEVHQFYKEEWRQITMDYLENYPSTSPIYNKLCKDFPEFLASDFFCKKYGSNNYLSELALFKWLDLDLYNSTKRKQLDNGFIQDYVLFESNFNMPILVNFLNSEETINKSDDIEESPSSIFMFREETQTKNLILNSLTKEFIQELESGKDLNEIKSIFLEKYSESFENLEKDIESLSNYLKKMKILLI